MESKRTTRQRQVIALGIAVSLVVSVVPYTVLADDEPNDSFANAEAITIGQATTGTLEVGGDVDFYRFDADRGQEVNVTLLAPDVQADASLIQFDLQSADGDFLASGGVGSSGGTDSIGDTVEADGTYYVGVSNFYDVQTPYTLTVTVTDTDDFEPNERPEDAVSVATDETIDAELSSGDIDFYRFDADRGQEVNVTLLAPDVQADASLIQFDLQSANGDVLASGGVGSSIGSSFGGTDSIGDTVEADGTYYVGVSNFYNTPRPYTLMIDVTDIDSFEPNERATDATALFENPFDPDNGIITQGDEDWFGYDLQSGQELTATLSATGTERLKVLVFPPGADVSAVEAITNAGTNETVTYTATSAGRHAVGVTPVLGSSGSYDLSVAVDGEPVGLPNDRFERSNPPVGNNDRSTATELSPGAYTGLGMVDDDRDVFAVDLDAGDRLYGIVTDAASGDVLTVETLTPEGDVLNATTTADGRAVAVLDAASTDTYYVRVAGPEGGRTVYDLELVVLPEVSVAVDDESRVTVAPGESERLNVVVAGANAGVGSFDLSFASADPSVVRVDAVDPIGGDLDATVAEDGSGVTAVGTGLSTSGTNPAVLAMTISGVTDGETTLSVDTDTVSTPAGFGYPVTDGTGTTVLVSNEPAEPTLDDYDSNGDGLLTAFDVLDVIVAFNTGAVDDISFVLDAIVAFNAEVTVD